MNFHILTLFPDMVERGLNTSIIGRAVGKGLLNIETINIRDYTLDRHKKVDDYPYGGGAGMAGSGAEDWKKAKNSISYTSGQYVSAGNGKGLCKGRRPGIALWAL